MVMAWIHLLLLLPCLLFSAEFTASVNQNQVGVGEGFVLNLTLKDASAKASPAVEFLKKDFLVYSQQHSSNTSIVNGAVSSSVTWSLTLIPQVAGEVEIPSISIETSEGKLFTRPIAMKILQEKKSSGGQSGEDIWLETTSSSQSPYKNEPFFFTIRLVSKRTVTNLQAGKFDVADAIVELAGTPMVKEKIENGMKFGVVEFKYLVTPLKSGPLTIPSITIQGGIPQKKAARSPFDDPFDSFFMMQGLGNVLPFALSTKELTIDIRPPLASVVPWLPAQALDIQEQWDGSQVFREGDVFTRNFVISAQGVHSSQLPSLEGKLSSDGQFKVYADKPELKDEIVNGVLKSYRMEQYTLIPQRSGELTLPEISVSWWNTTKGEKRETHVASRQLQVLPAATTRNIAPSDDKEATVEEESDTPTVIMDTHPLVYILIGGLMVLLAIVIVLLIAMQRKMKRMLEVPTEQKSKVAKEPVKKVPRPSVAVARPESTARKKRDKLDDLNPT